MSDKFYPLYIPKHASHVHAMIKKETPLYLHRFLTYHSSKESAKIE